MSDTWGLDIPEAMLAFVPKGIRTRAGSMTELPFDDTFFDGAYATESLEHTVEIKKAVSGICRVVKLGGRAVIIDKNAEQWDKLATPEWECARHLGGQTKKTSREGDRNKTCRGFLRHHFNPPTVCYDENPSLSVMRRLRLVFIRGNLWVTEGPQGSPSRMQVPAEKPLPDHALLGELPAKHIRLTEWARWSLDFEYES